MTDDTPEESINAMVEAAASCWRGCEWNTSFGKTGLNLRGMRPNQTRMMAEATSGDEAKDWDAATYWLLNVERDARDAKKAALLSVSLFHAGNLLEAAKTLETVIQLESQYREPVAWVELYELVIAAVV